MHYCTTNRNGMTAKWIARGATLSELHVPDRDGQVVDVVLGFDDETGYASAANQHFGCTTGRYANRIRAGRFTLDRVEYQLAVNNGPNHLHGGTERSLDKVVWTAKPIQTKGGDQGVRFRYISPDGDEGYPGRLVVTVAYVLSDPGRLRNLEPFRLYA